MLENTFAARKIFLPGTLTAITLFNAYFSPAHRHSQNGLPRRTAFSACAYRHAHFRASQFLAGQAFTSMTQL
jgi:hypothetical protein